MKNNENFVISGVSGRFPRSNTIDELARNLFNKTDFATVDDARYPPGIFGLADRTAKVENLHQFDNEYFHLSAREADYLDPEIRQGLEVTVEALLDAGIPPETIRGTQTGVYVGTGESYKYLLADTIRDRTINFHCSASEISHFLDLRGPAMAVDTACAASLTALQTAIIDLSHNQCEMAIVLGLAINLNFTLFREFQELKMSSPAGRCKVWDKEANGFMNSECISAIVIQRESEAQRIYAHILSVVCNSDGYKDKGITFPSWEGQRDVMTQACREARVNPLDIHYIEAHGTGTQAGDSVECRSIAEAMCVMPGRKEPLAIGAVKSCMGHALTGSGHTSLVKSLIIMESGLIPPDQNFSKVNPKCETIANGTLVNVIETTPFKGDYIGINVFGFGGANYHCLLKRHLKEKSASQNIWTSATGEALPRLICVNGRSIQTMKHFFASLAADERRLLDPEFLALINEINQGQPSSGMVSRGYAMVLPPEVCGLKPTFEQGDILLLNSSIERYPKSVQLTIHASDIEDIADWTAILKDLCSFPLAKLRIQSFLESRIAPISRRALKRVALTAIADLLGYLGIPITMAKGISSGGSTARHTRGIKILLEAAKDAETNTADIRLDHNANLERQGSVFLVSWKIAGSEVKSIEIRTRDIKQSLINALGQLYIHGFNVDLSKLYQPVTFPVSRGTPNVSSLIQWRHERNHVVLKFPECCNSYRRCKIARRINPKEGEYKYLMGHIIDGRPLLPAPCYLDVIWQLEAERLGCEMIQTKVRFSRVKFHRATMLQEGSEVELHCAVTPAGWEITDASGTKLASGCLQIWRKDDPKCPKSMFGRQKTSGHEWPHDKLILETPDFYKLLRLRGYDYGPTFFGIQKVTSDARQAEVKWTGKWVTFADSMMQAADILDAGSHSLFLPVGIDTVECDLERLIDWVDENGVYVPSECNTANKTFAAPGILIKGVHVSIAPRRMMESPCLERCSFYPFKEENAIEPGLRASISEYLTMLNEVRCLPEDLELGTVPNDLGSYVKANASTAVALKILSEAKCGSHEGDDQSQRLGNHGRDHQRGQAERSTDGSDESRVQESQKAVVKDYEDRLLERFNAHKSELVNDLIESALSSDRIFRQLLDIAIEANLRSPMTIHEFTLASVPMHSQVMKSMLMNVDHMSSRPGITYVIHHPRPKEVIVAKNEWNEPSKQEWSQYPSVLRGQAESKHEENPEKKGSKAASPKKFTVKEGCDPDTVNLAVFRLTTIESLVNIAQNGWNLTDFLGSVHKALKVGGFVFLALKECFLAPELELIDAILKSTGQSLPEITFWRSLTDVLAWVKTAEKVGFSVVGYKSDSISGCALLLRKLSPERPDLAKLQVIEVPETYLYRGTHDTKDYEWVEDLKQAVKMVKESEDPEQKLWLMSRGQRFTGVHGLFGELRREYGNKVRCLIDLREMKGDADPKQDILFREVVKLDLSMTIIDEHGRFGGYFFSDFSGPECIESSEGAAALKVRGDLSSFEWLQLNNERQPSPSSKEVKVSIHYSALNFRDVMMASGRLLPPILTGDELKDNVLGFEFSGVDENGERVMGICNQMGLATSITLEDRQLLFKVPDHWTLEEAATVPLVYGTAYYSLITRGQIKRGESILIHSATGGVGQAAVNLALSRGLIVYATVGSEEKRKWLLKQFPQIDPRNIASSRNLSFEKMIISRTRGRGVDLVLNSLSGDKLHASIRCLAPKGRFLEIGKVDMQLNEDLNLLQLEEKSFHAIGLDVFTYKVQAHIPVNRPDRMPVLRSAFDLMMEDAHRGIVKPLNRTVYGHDRIEDAFRYLASGAHMGKVLIQMRPEAPVLVTLPAPIKQVHPRVIFDPNKSYLIVGGLGGMGIEMAYWMVQRGARHLVLTSRSGVKNGFQKFRLAQMRNDFKANVLIVRESMLTRESAIRVLAETIKLGPLGGVFNLAMVLMDNFFEKQSPESFEKVNCKGIIALHLDRLTRDPRFCPQPLDYFVCFSSISNRFNMGQPNYNYANAIQERICEMRRKDALHGLAIQWGPIGDVGYVADRELTKDKLNFSAARLQRIPSVIYHLEQFLLSGETVVSSWIKNMDAPLSRNVSALTKLCHLMGIKDPDVLDPKSTLGELGMDSLVAVEVRQLLEREYDIFMSAEKIAKLTVEDCRSLEKGTSKHRGPTTDESGSPEIQDQDESFKFDKTSKWTNFLYDMSQVVKGLYRFYVSLNEFDPEKVTEALIVLPGAVGTFEPLEGLGAALEPLPLIGLNWMGEYTDLPTYNQICERMLANLEAAFPRLVTFNFAGHSMGANDAFELARYAQNRGRFVRSLIFFDSSPALLYHVYYRLEEDDIPEVYNEAEGLMTFAKMYLPTQSLNNIRQEMSYGNTVDQQRHLVLTMLRDQFSLIGQNFKLKDIKLAAQVYRHRIGLCVKISRTPLFAGNALLIKSSHWKTGLQDIDSDSAVKGAKFYEEDYSVSRWIGGKCTVHTSEGLHELFIKNNPGLIAKVITEFIEAQKAGPNSS